MRLLRSAGRKPGRIKIPKKKKIIRKFKSKYIGRLSTNRIRCYGHV
jgi:hypothetical protein